MNRTNVHCAECNAELGPEILGQEKPCPFCGSMNRIYSEHVACKTKVRVLSPVKHRRLRKDHPIFESRTGDARYIAKKKWVIQSRTIDRENDEFHEILRDARTGKVIRASHEALSIHTEHDASKSKPVQ